MPPKAKPDTAAYQKLKKDIKEGTIGTLYVFHGEEAYLRDFYLGQLKKKLLPAGMEEFNLHTLSGKEFDVKTLAQLVDCLPMMSQRTMVVVYDYDRHFAAQQGQQRLPARYRPAMEAVNDGAVRAYHDGQCPAVGQDRLDKQLQVFLADLVGVVVVGVNSVAVYPLEGCQRGEYINAFHGSAPP